MSFIMMSLIIGVFAFPARSQDNDMNYDEMEKTQNEIEDLYMDVYKIIDEYPDVTYEYVYNDGKVSEVVVEGIPNNRDKKQLEVYLIDLDQLKREMYDMSNRVGVYYFTETEPEPKMGYRDFYQDLYSNIQYPESATDNGVEGTVFVKFVIDSQGDVEHVIASENIQAPGEWIVKDMKQEAKKAVEATSGEWKPARIGDIPVAHWMVLPVQFKIKTRPLLRGLL